MTFLVRLRTYDDDELDQEVINAVVKFLLEASVEPSRALLCSDRADLSFLNRFDAVRTSKRLTASEKDDTLLAACWAALSGSSSCSVITTDDRLSVQTLPDPRVSIGVAVLMEEVRQSLNRGELDNGCKALRSLRSALRASHGAARLATSLRELQTCLEREKDFFCSEFPVKQTDIELRARRSGIRDLLEFVSEQHASFIATRKALTLLPHLLEHRCSYTFLGVTLAGRFKVQNVVGRRIEVLVWLTAYLLRLGHIYCSKEDGAGSLSVTLRALETYLAVCIVLRGRAQIGDNGLELLDTGRAEGTSDRVEGVGRRWGIFNDLFPGFEAEHPKLHREIGVLIGLRNRSVFGHGVQRLSVDQARVCGAAVRAFVEKQEELHLASREQWQHIWNASQGVDCRSSFIDALAAGLDIRV